MFASRLWKNLFFLTHSSQALVIAFYHTNIILIHFYWLLLLDSVLGFPALVSRILWKPLIWLLSRFNWLVATWCDIWASGCRDSRNRLQIVLHVFISVCVYICAYMYVCVYVFVCVNVDICVHVCVYVYVCICVRVCVRIYIYIYIYIFVYVCMYIYAYIYLYIIV